MRDTGWFSINVITTPWNAKGTSWTTPWKNPGGDFSAKGVDTLHFYDGALTWNTFNITSAAKEFVRNPSSNNGLIITVAMDDPTLSFTNLGRDTVYQLGQYHGVIAGAEGGAENKKYRPRVTVTYTTDPTGIYSTSMMCREKIRARSVGNGVLALWSPVRGVCMVMDIRGRRLDAFDITQANRWITKGMHCGEGIVCIHIKEKSGNCLHKVIAVR
jgi:hypothetical protein